MRLALGLLGALALAAAAAANPAASDAVAPFFAGKSITLYIGSTVGGGYDSYARLLARHLGDHVPGHPTVVPVNLPGAGSFKAAYFIYAVAPKDGTAIGAVMPGAITAPLLTDTPVPHDPRKLAYLGSTEDGVFLCIARSDAPVKRFADMFTTSLRLAASAVGGSTRDFPAMLDNVLGTKFELVTGYPGTREEMLAVEQGEVQGQCGLDWSSLMVLQPNWLAQGKIRILAQEALKGEPAANAMHVPLTLDFAKTPEERQVLELVYTQEVFGRPYVLPPGVPAERVAALRQAFMATMQDQAFLADAARMRLEITPVSGEALQRLVAKMYATPQSIVDRAKAALVYQAP